MIKQSIQSISLGLATFAALSVVLMNGAVASPIYPNFPAGNGQCTLSDIQITEIKRQDGSDALPFPNAGNPIDASGCFGAFEGNDSVSGVGDNRGFVGDGMLNDISLFPDYGAFLSEDDLLDLQGLGKIDPGWIFVGKIDYETEGSKYTNGTVKRDGYEDFLFAIEDILIVNFYEPGMKSGTFTYRPPQTNPQGLLDVLGANKFFDQAAVIFKASNQWAIYNFRLDDLGLPPVIGTQDVNFEFSGTFDLAGTFVTGNIDNGGNTPDLSHVSFWLRDPFGDDTVTVPAPGTLLSLLMGLGLLLAGRRRRMSTQ